MIVLKKIDPDQLERVLKNESVNIRVVIEKIIDHELNSISRWSVMGRVPKIKRLCLELGVWSQDVELHLEFLDDSGRESF